MRSLIYKENSKIAEGSKFRRILLTKTGLGITDEMLEFSVRRVYEEVVVLCLSVGDEDIILGENGGDEGGDELNRCLIEEFKILENLR